MTDDEYRDMIEAVAQLQGVREHPGWQTLTEFAHTTMRGTKEGLLNGHAADIEKYREQTGWLKGIHFVLDAADTLQEAVDRERRRREERATVDSGV